MVGPYRRLRARASRGVLASRFVCDLVAGLPGAAHLRDDRWGHVLFIVLSFRRVRTRRTKKRRWSLSVGWLSQLPPRLLPTRGGSTHLPGAVGPVLGVRHHPRVAHKCSNRPPPSPAGRGDVSSLLVRPSRLQGRPDPECLCRAESALSGAFTPPRAAPEVVVGSPAGRRWWWRRRWWRLVTGR
jgi:hypothetical protein